MKSPYRTNQFVPNNYKRPYLKKIIRKFVIKFLRFKVNRIINMKSIFVWAKRWWGLWIVISVVGAATGMSIHIDNKNTEEANHYHVRGYCGRSDVWHKSINPDPSMTECSLMRVSINQYCIKEKYDDRTNETYGDAKDYMISHTKVMARCGEAKENYSDFTTSICEKECK
jgi:hypothetical protein